MKCKLDERTLRVYQSYIARETKGLTNDVVWVGLAPCPHPHPQSQCGHRTRAGQGTERSAEIETWLMPSQFGFPEVGWVAAWIGYSAESSGNWFEKWTAKLLMQIGSGLFPWRCRVLLSWALVFFFTFFCWRIPQGSILDLQLILGALSLSLSPSVSLSFSCPSHPLPSLHLYLPLDNTQISVALNSLFSKERSMQSTEIITGWEY